MDGDSVRRQEDGDSVRRQAVSLPSTPGRRAPIPELDRYRRMKAEVERMELTSCAAAQARGHDALRSADPAPKQGTQCEAAQRADDGPTVLGRPPELETNPSTPDAPSLKTRLAAGYDSPFTAFKPPPPLGAQGGPGGSESSARGGEEVEQPRERRHPEAAPRRTSRRDRSGTAAAVPRSLRHMLVLE